MRWIQAFLINRQQMVVADSEQSDSDLVTPGVLQGSVLGTIVFLAYNNDLPQYIVSQVRLFADDTAIFLTLYSRHYRLFTEGLGQTPGMGIKVGHGVQPPKCHAVHVTSSRAPFDTRYIGSVCSDQTGLGFEPVWRTTRLLTLNRKRFDHLLYTKLKPVYQTDQTTLGDFEPV